MTGICRSRHGLFAAVSLTAAVFFLAMVLQAAWIPVKAELAQWLIARSWQSVLEGAGDARPWPWADTRAAAVLEAPERDLRLIVLEGNSGRNLAFGPVFADGTARGRDMVISGHRDTHFRFLRALRVGDRLRVTRQRGTQWFDVQELEVVDSRKVEILIDPGMDRLSLVTCFPFDSPRAGGPLRYVVTALPGNPPTKGRFSPRSPSSG
jgi:sortase A